MRDVTQSIVSIIGSLWGRHESIEYFFLNDTYSTKAKQNGRKKELFMEGISFLIGLNAYGGLRMEVIKFI